MGARLVFRYSFLLSHSSQVSRLAPNATGKWVETLTLSIITNCAYLVLQMRNMTRLRNADSLAEGEGEGEGECLS